MLIYKTFIIPHLIRCAGTSLRQTLIKYDMDNLKKITEHDSKFTLAAADFAKNYESLVIVRNPYHFYESLYNHHKGIHTINTLSTVVERNSKFNSFYSELKDFDSWLEAMLDLPAFFKKYPHLIKSFVRELGSRGDFLNSWFYDKPLNKLQPEDFIGSFYQFMFDKLVPDNHRIFKIESDIPQFLNYIGMDKKLLKSNVTETKDFKLKEYQKEKIYQKDKELFKKFRYQKDEY